MHLRNRAPHRPPEIELLRDLPLFTDWNERRLCRLLKHGERVRLEAGDTLRRERRTCNELYIVLGGSGGVIHGHGRVLDLAEGELIADVARHIEDDHVVQFEADEPMELLCLDLAYVVDL